MAHDIQTQSATNTVKQLSINTMNIEVLTVILQEVIEYEADDHIRYNRYQPIEPTAAIGLALVCKKWRDIVFSTPSMWPIIKLSMTSSVETMQAKLNRLASRTKNAPVDLHILEVHSNKEPTALCSHRRGGHCCCTFDLDFTCLSNVRPLRVHFGRNTALPCFDPSLLPSLNQVKDAYFFVWNILPDVSQLLSLLRHAPGIVVLDLCWVGIHDLPWAQRNHALMPNLRTLIISAGGRTRPENAYDHLPSLWLFSNEMAPQATHSNVVDRL